MLFFNFYLFHLVVFKKSAISSEFCKKKYNVIHTFFQYWRNISTTNKTGVVKVPLQVQLVIKIEIQKETAYSFHPLVNSWIARNCFGIWYNLKQWKFPDLDVETTAGSTQELSKINLPPIEKIDFPPATDHFLGGTGHLSLPSTYSYLHVTTLS